MKYIFATIGGCASRYLISNLSKKYIVGDKPDAIFQPILKPLGIDPGTFESRSKGFSTNINVTLEQVFPKYIEFIKRNHNMTAVFNFAAEKHLFSKYEIKNVVFQVRHPLHSYLSFAKPERHGSKIEYFGGINSITAIEYYCKRWLSLIEEFFRLKSLNIRTWLLRYEFIHLDIEKLPDLKWLYTDFDSSKRNHYIISKQSEKYLRDFVSNSFFKIYRKWNL